MEIRGASSGAGSLGRRPGLSKELLQEKLDAAKQGGVDVPSALSDLGNSFDTYDVDGSGVIDRSEFSAFAEKAGIKLPKGKGPGSEGLTEEGLKGISSQLQSQGLSTGYLPTLMDQFKNVDKDSDGALQMSEFQAFADTQQLAPLNLDLLLGGGAGKTSSVVSKKENGGGGVSKAFKAYADQYRAQQPSLLEALEA